MIGLGFRLAVGGGREALVRLVTIAGSVAVGVGLLLTTLAGVNAVNTQIERYSWLHTVTTAADDATATDPTLWLSRENYFRGATITRLDVAATGPDSPVPPGIPRLPGPGEFYASPELEALLRSSSADQLGDRIPGQQVGAISQAALAAPDSLLVVVGRTPAELAGLPEVRKVTGICADCRLPETAAALHLVLAVVAGALIFPLLIFIGTTTRLSAARREQRFAAMRMVGATPRQVSAIGAVEALVSAVVGTVLGFGLYLLFRRPAAAIPFTGESFFPEDLRLTPVDVGLVAVGVPVAAAVVARLALRRVRISPFGVTRRVRPHPPRAYRVIPLLLGLAELAWFIGNRPRTSTGQLWAFLPGILVVMVGLVVAGPWLTMAGSRLLARRVNRPAGLIAARRLADDPKGAFRAVSGLVLALFVTTVSVGVITTIVKERGALGGSPGLTNLVQLLPAENAQVPAQLEAELRATPGVRRLAIVHETPRELRQRPGGTNLPGLLPCAVVADYPDFGRCAPGAEVAAVSPYLLESVYLSTPDGTWPTAPISADRLTALPAISVVVGTDGSAAAIERARTRLAEAYPGVRFAATEAEFEASSTNSLTVWKQLANVAILASLAIAGCNLAVGVLGGLSDRRRPFSMLRLSGVPVRILRRVVVLESAVPLLVAAVVTIGTGFLAAHLFLRAQMSYSLHLPGITYYVAVLGGLAACLGVVAATLPLLERITGPERVRNE